jgi:hypothetical protein
VKYAGVNVVGIELGVAEGEFSHSVLANQDVAKWYSVDMWAGDRGHDQRQHHRALDRLRPFGSRSTVIQSRFCDLVDEFPAEYFDFIYVDGYAHTGQEGGETLAQWWPKLKPGGVFAGDDYDPAWPLTVQSVDAFCAQHQLELHIHEFTDVTHWSRHPSWYVYKPCDPAELTFDQLVED